MSTELLPNKAEEDQYYNHALLGYYGSAEIIVIPACFLLILIFGLMDVVSYYVRMALKKRKEKERRRRRETRRRRQRRDRKNTPSNIDTEVPSLIARVVKFIGYVFESKIKKIVKEAKDKEKKRENKEKSSSTSTTETQLYVIPPKDEPEYVDDRTSSKTSNSIDEDKRSSIDTTSPSEQPGHSLKDDDDDDETTTPTSSEQTNSTGSSRQTDRTRDTRSESIRVFLEQQQQSVLPGPSSKTDRTRDTSSKKTKTSSTSKDSSSLQFKARPETKKDVDPRLARYQGNEQLQRSESIRVFLEQQQQSVSPGPSSKMSKRRRRKAHRK